MSPVLVDSNVLLDVSSTDSPWRAWSARMIESAGNESILVINPLIYAGVSAGFESVADVDTALPLELFRREELPYDAAFLAGRAFVQYRRRGGMQRSPLPDFYIGAHAAVAGYRLLTRDAARYQTYFPTVDLIAPTSS